MNGLEHYMSLNYRIEVIKDEAEGGYVASYPLLKGCITCAKDIATAVAMLEDAKREWIVAALEDGVNIPEPDCDERYSGQFKLRIPKSLHRKLADESKREGISMNQYCLYLLSKNSSETIQTI
ncbi:MAG TPA: type II toxin-antitoxin system HicB family antitoxin [Anaerovoracaceae bacterium]|nr:type II toxin-antitoxin system HicB family antitoxin [Anaerovoracaceae bacterium]